jgi:hypothetical protein
MGMVGASLWGPVPIACIWVGGRVQYASGNRMMLGIVAAMLSLLVAVFAGLKTMTVLDGAWILARRAGGVHQSSGAIVPIFAVSAALGVVFFTLWFLLLAGPGPSLG